MIALKAVKGAGWLIFSKFSGRAIDFFTLLLLTRILNPADFGLAALAISLVVVTDTILEVPVTQALVRLSVIDKSHLDTAFTVSFIRNVLLAIILITAAWPFSIFNRDPMLLPFISVLAIAPVVRGFASPAMVHFARELGFWQTFVMEFSGKLCAAVVAAATVLSGGGYWAIASNFVTTSVVATIASYILAPYRPAFSLSRLSDFSGTIGWYNFSQVVSALSWQSDRFFIGAVSDKATLGRYAVASDVSVIPMQSIIGPTLQPIVAAFSQISGDPVRFNAAFLKATRFAMLVAVPVCLGISLNADLVTSLLFGSKWDGASSFLSVLALAVIPSAYFQTLFSACVSLNRIPILFRINSTELILRVVLIPIGYYSFAVFGVTIARLFLSVAMFCIYMAEIRNMLSIGISVQLKNIWKIGVAALVMAIAVLAIRKEISPLILNHVTELSIVSIVGAATYGITLFSLGIRLLIGPGRLELNDVAFR